MELNMEQFVAFLLALGCYSVVADCPNGFVRHDYSCYKVFLIPTTWTEAIVFCEVFEAELAEITTAREQHFIESYLHPVKSKLTGDVWIGGTDILVEGSFYWSRSGDPVEYKDWSPGEPTNSGSGENCMALFTLYDFKWNDAPCQTKQMFLCEIPGDVYQTGSIIG